MKLSVGFLLFAGCIWGQMFNASTPQATPSLDRAGIGVPTIDCTITQRYFQVDATPGQNNWSCTAANVWTKQAGGPPYACTVSGVSSIACTHNLGTTTPWVTCYDSSGNNLGGTGASSFVTSIVATSSNVATITFSGTTTGVCAISTGSMGPVGATGAAGPAGSNGAISQVQNSGTNLTVRPTINFTGAGVTCVDNPGSNRTDCTITGTAATIAHVQSCSNNAPGLVSGVTCTFSSPITAGNFLHVCVSNGTPSSTITLTGDSGTQVVDVPNVYTAGVGGYANCWYVASAGGGGTVLTASASPSVNYMGISGDEFSDVHPTAPFDQINYSATGTGTTGTSASITPPQNGALLIGFTNPAGGVTINATAPFLSGQPSSAYSIQSYFIQATAASVAAAFTYGSSQPWIAAIAAFKHR